MAGGGSWLKVFLNVCSCAIKKIAKQGERLINDKQ